MSKPTPRHLQNRLSYKLYFPEPQLKTTSQILHYQDNHYFPEMPDIFNYRVFSLFILPKYLTSPSPRQTPTLTLTLPHSHTPTHTPTIYPFSPALPPHDGRRAVAGFAGRCFYFFLSLYLKCVVRSEGITSSI